MKKRLLLTAALFSGQALATDLKYTCTHDNCVIYADTQGAGRVVILPQVSPPEMQNKTTLKQYSQSLAAIITSCGNPCNYTTYVDLQTGKSSQPYFLVMALDTQHQLLAYPSKDLKGISVSNIFNPSNTLEIQRDFSPSATVYQVASAEFRADGLFIDYLEGPAQIERKELIPINYHKLTPESATS